MFAKILFQLQLTVDGMRSWWLGGATSYHVTLTFWARENAQIPSKAHHDLCHLLANVFILIYK